MALDGSVTERLSGRVGLGRLHSAAWQLMMTCRAHVTRFSLYRRMGLGKWVVRRVQGATV